MEASAVTLLLALFLFGKGYGYDEELKCPDKFNVEKVNTLTLQVNSTVIEHAECAVKPTYLGFTIKRVGASTVSTICSTRFSCPSPGPVGEPTQKQPVCGCVKKSQNSIVSFEMKLYVNESTDSRANFSFNLCNLPVHKVNRNIERSCSVITVDRQVTSSSSSSTEHLTTVLQSTSTQSPLDHEKEGSPCGTGCIVGIVIGVIVVIAVILGVICFLRSRRADYRKKDTGETEGCQPEVFREPLRGSEVL